MAHAPSRRGGLAGDEADHGLLEFLLDVGRGFVLGRAADLADEDDGLGPGIVLEQPQKLDIFEPDDRVAPDADRGGLAQALLGHLLDGLVGQRSRAGNDADRARRVDVTGHDADLALAGRDDARRVGPDQLGRPALQERLDLDHVQRRDALGDAADQVDPGVGAFHDGVGRGERRHEDAGGVGPGLPDGVGDGVEDGPVQVLGPALARRHAGHDLGAVFDHARGVEGALGPRDPQDHDLGAFVDQDAHGRLLRRL